MLCRVPALPFAAAILGACASPLRRQEQFLPAGSNITALRAMPREQFTPHYVSPSTKFTVPTASSSPNRIVAGPEGAFRITELQANAIARITRLAGKSTEYHLAASSYPTEITLGPDGALWFTEQGANKIGRLY